MFGFGFTHLKSQKNKLIIYIIITYSIGLFSLSLPIISGEIINVISDTKDVERLFDLVFIFGALFISKVFVQYITYKLYIKIQTVGAFTINSEVISHIQNIPLDEVDCIDTSYVNQRVNSDSNAVVSFVINFCTDLGINIITMLFCLVALLNINLRIAVIIIFVLFFYLMIYIVLKKKVYSMSYMFKESQADFFSVLTEQLENIQFVQAHAMGNLFKQKLFTRFHEFLNKVLKSQTFIYLYNSLDDIINGVMQVIVYLYCGLSVMQENMTIGEFFIIISFFGYVMSSIKYFSDLGREYQENLMSYNRLKEYLNKDTEDNGKQLLKKIENIECKNLTFARGNKTIIDNFSYKFSTGNIYGITGGNGTGKTTLINLILGLYKKSNKDMVFYEGIAIKDIDMQEVRKNLIAVVEQFPYTFPGTIKENILLNEYYKEDKINDFLKKTKMLKLSLSKKIYKDGSGLSGGEKQKIALLRAIAKEADVLILDEPTSALDIFGAEIFIHYLEEIKHNKIIIIVSHDSNLNNLYDFIIPLN